RLTCLHVPRRQFFLFMAARTMSFRPERFFFPPKNWRRQVFPASGILRLDLVMELTTKVSCTAECFWRAALASVRSRVQWQGVKLRSPHDKTLRSLPSALQLREKRRRLQARGRGKRLALWRQPRSCARQPAGKGA